MYKCFDQIQRPLMYKLLRRGGMPEKVLGTYAKFLEALSVRNNIVGGIGTPYKPSDQRESHRGIRCP